MTSTVHDICTFGILCLVRKFSQSLFAALESEEDYIEAPNLLFKINLHFYITFCNQSLLISLPVYFV